MSECRCGCGRTPVHARGLAKSCYDRSRWHGWPGALPPRPSDRREDYAELRSWGIGRRDAAARIGVCLRTIDRYEARLRVPA
jgi:hypothetical protein